MLFNSFQFLIFFPVVVSIYFAIPYRFRWIILLIASYYFYMCWRVEYILLIIISTLVDYIASNRMGKIESKSKRTKYLIFSLVANLGLLFSFKYFNFFNSSLKALFDHYNIGYSIPALDVLLPVGISFYTFQTLSYTIEVYRGRRKPERHLGIFALYVSFFPQLVAGPIERPHNLLPQFYNIYDFDAKRVGEGLLQMLWGFFKKLVIADRLAIYVNNVYGNSAEHYGISLIIATYFFAFQIYCDFSGYSDIAIGGAKVMGFKLMNNFNRPYFSRSISEFWKRWHISLSSWFKDYLYIPLGGNRVSIPRWYFNLFFVFLVSGLWHGSNWTFILWGALHGFYLIFSILTSGIRNRISNLLFISRFPRIQNLFKIFTTFHLVLFSWILFRANSISEAFLIIKNMFKIELSVNQFLGIFAKNEMIIAIVAILLMEIIHIIQSKVSITQFLSGKPFWFKWAVYYSIIVIILMFGKLFPNETMQFIYFQF